MTYSRALQLIYYLFFFFTEETFVSEKNVTFYSDRVGSLQTAILRINSSAGQRERRAR